MFAINVHRGEFGRMLGDKCTQLRSYITDPKRRANFSGTNTVVTQATIISDSQHSGNQQSMLRLSRRYDPYRICISRISACLCMPHNLIYIHNQNTLFAAGNCIIFLLELFIFLFGSSLVCAGVFSPQSRICVIKSIRI